MCHDIMRHVFNYVSDENKNKPPWILLKHSVKMIWNRMQMRRKCWNEIDRVVFDENMEEFHSEMSINHSFARRAITHSDENINDGSYRKRELVQIHPIQIRTNRLNLVLKTKTKQFIFSSSFGFYTMPQSDRSW